MEVKRLDIARSKLFHFALWILLVLLAAISYMAYRQYPPDTISVMTVLALLFCLYAVGKERRLRKQQLELGKELSSQQDKSADLEARLKELSALYRAISTVNASASPERTFAAVLTAGLELVGGNRGSLMLLDEDEEYMVIAAAEGIEQDIVAQTKQKVGEGVAGWVVANRKPVLLSGSAAKDERFQSVVNHRAPARYSISAPLHLRDTVLGVINVGIVTDEPDEKFTDYHMRMVTIFAQHASVAIENARLRLMRSVLLTVVEA